MPASDKVRETVRQEADRVSGLAQDAARSGAYLYPIKVQKCDPTMMPLKTKTDMSGRESRTTLLTASYGSLCRPSCFLPLVWDSAYSPACSSSRTCLRPLFWLSSMDLLRPSALRCWCLVRAAPSSTSWLALSWSRTVSLTRSTA